MPRYCRACGAELPGRKIYYCNDACRDVYYRQEGYMLPDWPEKSKRFLEAHPICQKCGIAPSTETHHKIPRRLGGTDDEKNLLAACSKCHHVLDNEIARQERERIKARLAKKRRPKRVRIIEGAQLELL